MESTPANKKKVNGCLTFIGVALVLFILFAIFSPDSKKAGDKKETKTDQAVADIKPKNWIYDSSAADRMNGAVTYRAINTSPDVVEFKFPYQGGSNLSFLFRNNQGSLDAYLKISKGQFMDGYNHNVRIKFDNEKPFELSYTGTDDGNANVIFLQSPRALLARVKKAKKMLVECSFFQEGTRQFEFDVSELQWSK